MFNSIKERLDNYKSSKRFNAQNCLRKQIAVEKQNLNKRIEEIASRINYVVESTTSEHTVIYQVHDYEKKMFEEIENYFQDLGFTVITMVIPELGNDEYMIISWKNSNY